jgi:hypothetical protein
VFVVVVAVAVAIAVTGRRCTWLLVCRLSTGYHFLFTDTICVWSQNG